MHGNIQSSITIQNGVKGIIGSRDLRRLFFDVGEDTESILNSPTQTWKQKRKESFQIEQIKKINQMNQEVANNILTDSILSQSYGNPLWYPPVPKYRKPKGKKYTTTQIAQIKMSRDIDFIEQNIVVGRTPLSSEDMDDEFTQLTKIDPYILSRTVIHEKDIDVITGHKQAPNFSYPEITSCVGYIVNTYVDLKTNKVYLSNIYVYNDAEAVNSLLSFLSELRVENMDDLRNSGEYFINLLSSK